MACQMGGWCRIVDHDAFLQALACCRGSYQQDLVRGVHSLSGSTLRGKAKKFGGRYAKSRDKLLRRMHAAGVVFSQPTEGRRRMLVLGE